MEAIVFVPVARALLARTETSEVLRSLGHIFVEDFKYNSLLLVAILALFTDRDIKVSLNIARLELRKTIVVFCLNGSFLLIVNTGGEESRESSLRLLCLLCFFALNKFKVLAEGRVRRINLDGSLDISSSVIKLIHVEACN